MSPKLSIVVVSRNDNHGGDLNHRTQIFINGISSQVLRTQMFTELIFVEWNPPQDRPPLKDAYEWPKNNPFLEVRIITVPFETHKQFKCHEGLPLIQMEGKNVGIRRAKGEYVLSTNIDLLFTKEMFDFIASDDLKKGVMYRCDRVDVEKDVPLEASLEEQLAYCKNHIIRICRKDGMWIPNSQFQGEMVKSSSQKGTFHSLKNFLIEIFLKPQKAAFNLSLKLPLLIYFVFYPAFLVWNFIFNVPFCILQLIWRTLRMTRLYQLAASLVYMKSFLSKAQFQDQSWSRSIKLAMVQNTTPTLHYNACGDFMLLDKESWFKFGSTPYYDGYSLHLDSLTLVNAFNHGIKFQELESPHVIYHIEHGGGWTPESEIKLFKAMNRKGVDILTWQDYLLKAQTLQEKKNCHQKLWGYPASNFQETIVNSSV